MQPLDNAEQILLGHCCERLGFVIWKQTSEPFPFLISQINKGSLISWLPGRTLFFLDRGADLGDGEGDLELETL